MSTFGKEAISASDRQLMDIQTSLELQFPQEVNSDESTAQTVRRLLSDLQDLRAMQKGRLAELSTIMQALSLASELRDIGSELARKCGETIKMAVKLEELCDKAGIRVVEEAIEADLYPTIQIAAVGK